MVINKNKFRLDEKGHHMGRFTSNVAILRSKFLNLVILKGTLPRPSDIHDIVLYTGISCHNFLYKSLLRSVWL